MTEESQAETPDKPDPKKSELIPWQYSIVLMGLLFIIFQAQSSSPKPRLGSRDVTLTFRAIDEKTREPLAGTEVELCSIYDVTMGKATTDREGIAKIDYPWTLARRSKFWRPFYGPIRVDYFGEIRTSSPNHGPARLNVHDLTGARIYHNSTEPPPIEIPLVPKP